jgi:hypothetical protein
MHERVSAGRTPPVANRFIANPASRPDGPPPDTREDKWSAGPRSYLGVMVAGFPNLFTIAGQRTCHLAWRPTPEHFSTNLF